MTAEIEDVERLLAPLTAQEQLIAQAWFAGDETAWPALEASIARRVGAAMGRLARERGEALDRVEALCVEMDRLSFRESPTTRRIREGGSRGGSR